MKITKIEKKKRLYLVELDATDRLYVTEDTLIRFMLSKDKELSQQDLAEIKAFAQFSHGKNLALYHLSFKQRTVKEVRDYLTKQEIEAETIEQVLANLKADKWLDDNQYAQAFIDQNLLSGDKGPYLLKQKLVQKGISASLVDQLLAASDFEDLLFKVTEKMLGKYEGKLPAKKLKEKLTQNIINKGFSYQQASSAISQIQIEKDEESEQDLLFKELAKQERKYSKKYEGYELKQRLTQALARKGYDFSDIQTALREYL